MPRPTDTPGPVPGENPLALESQPVAAVIFDIGNVILHFSHERMCRQIGEVLGVDVEAARAAIFSDDLVALYDRGEVSTEFFLGRLRAVARREIEESRLRRAAAEIFSLNQPLIPIVEDLSRRGIRLVALSNTCEVHSEFFMRTFPIFSLFDSLVLSHEVRMRKPEPEIFALAVERCHVDVANCLFVDDIEEYVVAARAQGLPAHLYVGVDSLVDCLESSGLRDLGQVVGADRKR